jgi:hypothetical protein
VALDKAATDIFLQRVAKAFGEGGKSVEMACLYTGPGSAYELAGKLLSADEAAFVKQSEQAASMLTDAQTSMSWPGGLLIVFSGTVQNPPRPYLAYLKAEPQDGFRQTVRDGKTFLELLDKLFLTRDSKVYKIGMFLQKGDGSKGGAPGFEQFLYDKNITKSQTSDAAAYFYQGFLGLTHLVEAARHTHDFVVQTRKFISKLPIPEEEKYDLRTALVAYVKTSQALTISPPEFAEAYFPTPEMKDDYEAFCKKNSVPFSTFAKNLSECAKLFTNRTIKFPRQIKLTGPAETFADMVEMKPLPREDGETWTNITVKGVMKGES